MPINRTNILQQFDNEKIFGDQKLVGEENRNPLSITQDASGGYDIKQFTYPEDLSQSNDLQHYIVFYINIRGKSKFKNAKPPIDVDVSSRAQNRAAQGTLADTAIVGSGIAAGVAAGAAIEAVRKSKPTPGSSNGASGSSKIAKLATNALNGVRKAGAGRAAAGAGVLVAAPSVAVAALQQFSDTFGVVAPQRTTDAIMLPIEGVPSVKYSMQYKTQDFGILAGILGGSSAIESSLGGRLAEMGAGAVASIGNLAKVTGFTLGEKAVQAAKLSATVATNPFREVMFEAIDYRTFEFKYTFLPKSESEMYNVKRIIDLFKLHMHPELSGDGLFYVYPSEFEMQYYFRGERNTFLHKISTCVLKTMQVDYGGDGYFSSFYDGAPTDIRLSLQFQEIELLTKERIVKGY
jgi:hypothetical protein